jgi:Outer membrane lipoprotein-sorting protein
MTTLFHRFPGAALLAVALLAATPAWADPAGDKVLADMDVMLNKPADLYFLYDVVHQEPGAAHPRTMQFSVKVKGSRNLTEFLAPADQKGTRVLVLSRTEMYVWLPQFDKIRRVASHTTEQGFMGTTFEYDDMATPYYGKIYDGKIIEDTDDHWVVECTAKPDADVTYKKLHMTIDKKMVLPTRIDFYNDEGVLARTETRDDYVCDQGVCVFNRMRMTDHTRNDVWTELRMVEWKHDQGLPDSTFTVRALQSGM